MGTLAIGNIPDPPVLPNPKLGSAISQFRGSAKDWAKAKTVKSCKSTLLSDATNNSTALSKSQIGDRRSNAIRGVVERPDHSVDDLLETALD